MNQVSSLKLALYRSLREIFQVTVEATRNILVCDRVIVYDASSLPQTEILAESVAPEYASILGQNIKDPFLEGDYLEMYCYGMSLTIDDIYSSNASRSDLKDLEQLDVKSVAVAPIFIASKLWAFLVVHNCSQLKPWDLEVANCLAGQASAAEVAISKIIAAQKCQDVDRVRQIIENYQNQSVRTKEQTESVEKNHHTQHKQQKILIPNNIEKLLTNLKHKLNEETDLEDILNTTVVETRQLLKCDRVLIYRLDGVDRGVVVAESSAEGCYKALDETIDNLDSAAQYAENSLDEQVAAVDDTSAENTALGYLEQLENLGVKAGIFAPITYNGQLFGLLIAHQCSDNRIWQQLEINSLTEIANHLGTMLEQTKLSKNNQQAAQLADVQNQLEREKRWTTYFSKFIQQIRQSLSIEDILKTSVREVHNILECDRVLVYALNEDSYGEIIAESVSPGWTKAEGRVIQDPCFEARYLEKYRDGRFRAWHDIYKSGMSNCHIEQLEKLEVKANFVVPIIKEEKLFGLLVAQQCSDTRQWQQSEILWLTQISLQVGFALDNAQLIADARRLRQQAESERKWTEYFSDAVQQIRQSLKTKDVLKASVREVKRVLNCDRAVVYSLTQDNYGKIVAESVNHGWTRSEGRVIKDPCFEARYLDSYRDGRVRAWSNIYEAGMSNCYVEQLEQLEIKANVVTPIIHQGKLFGLLSVHQCSNTREWQESEIRWLTQIASQVGFALDNAQILEQIERDTQDTQTILARAVSSSANIQSTVKNAIKGFEHLDNSCQQFSETIQKVKDLTKQLAQQSMGMTRVLNLSQVEASSHNSIAEQSDKMFSLMQDLFEATAKIEPLFDNIATEIREKTSVLESESQKLVGEVGDFETASQKLERIVALNHEMSNLIEGISNSLENQIQNSTFARDSVDELADITARISQQSIAIISSFNQLASLCL